MDITVILCTYNRCQSLAKALESIAGQVIGDITWEILVVDNNSTDSTRAVVEQFRTAHPERCRYILEPRPGKAHALNTGIENAQGDVIAFTDDDVVADRMWLQNLVRPLRVREWAGIGGRILPEGSFVPPRWVPIHDRYALAPLSIFEPRREAGPLSEAPFGANMAFHRSVFAKHGGFRIDLGPKADSSDPQKSEDSELGHRLLNAGERLGYEPSALVYHCVPRSRVRKEYFLSWWYDKARSDVRAFGIRGKDKWTAAGVPVHLFRRLALWTIRWFVCLSPAQRFACKINVWSNAGEIFECYRQSQTGKDAFGPHLI